MDLSVEGSAKLVVDFLMSEDDVLKNVVYTERTGGFKIKIEMKRFPENLASAVRKSTRDMNTTFGGVKTWVRFLSSKVLESEDAEKLKALLQNFDSWCYELAEETMENMADYGMQFYAFANKNCDSESE